MDYYIYVPIILSFLAIKMLELIFSIADFKILFSKKKKRKKKKKKKTCWYYLKVRIK